MLRYARARLHIALFAAALSLPAAAFESISGSYRNRSALDSGGTRKSSSTYRADGSAGTITVSTSSLTSYLNRDGWMAAAYQPARVTDLWASSTTSPSAIDLQWTAPGNDGDENTTAGAFVIKYSSVAAESPALSDAKFNAAAVVILPPAPAMRGTLQTKTATGLDANTTYYFAIKTAERDGLRGVLSAGATAVTLAKLVTGTTVYQINVTSMVVNWSALPTAAQQGSSNSAAGYRLEVSSRADFSPVWASSVSWSVLQSTLSVGGLRGGVTYYFQVGTINSAGAVNYASSVSTLMPVQLGVDMTTRTISLPGLTPMNTVVMITTSTTLTNTGNVKETYYIRATTATSGSPWVVGPAQGADQLVVWSLVSPAEPLTSDFLADDRALEAETPCSAAAYSPDGAGTCVQIPVGATRILWFKVGTPLVTSTIAPQDVKIYARAVRDPDPDPDP